VIFVKGTLSGLLAFVAIVLFALSFYKYVTDAGTLWLVGWIVFLLVAIAFGGMFLSGRVNKGEDIHITE
jgi:uncharacterized membrane protein SirB2